MSEPGNDPQQRYRQFVDLMPLTLALAGLPPSEHPRYYTEDQVMARAMVIKHAYKAAKATLRESIEK